MSSSRAITTVLVRAAACVMLARGVVEAQTSCTINSTARGPLSCSVTTTVRMTVRMPALVGVSLTSAAVGSDVGSRPSTAEPIESRLVQAGLRVRANRSYALQIASASDAIESSAAAGRVTWSTPERTAPLEDAPRELRAHGSQTADDETFPIAFERQTPRSRDGFSPDPIRLRLTIVAP